jgi:RNA ligase (TIGR02306 family)
LSTFAVTLETIASTHPIPGADRIEVARLAGMDFQFVVGKGSYPPGTRVLYFPVDSLLPPELIERLGLTGKLAGRDRNRIKTITLRGQISQGVVAGAELVPPGLTDPAELTRALGVQKYEAPDLMVQDAVLRPLPDGQSRYDIESADRYVSIAELLMDQPVFITEKVEGSNLWVRAEPGGRVEVGQRSYSIQPKEGVEHSFYTIAARCGLPAFAAALAAEHGQDALIYGEALGPAIQGNIYKLPRQTVRLFDIRVGPRWLSPEELLAAVQSRHGDLSLLVPILQAPDGTTLRQWLGGRGVKEASDGPSLLGPTLREGIVIKPLQESRDLQIGRLLLKQRSPQYLSKSEL